MKTATSFLLVFCFIFSACASIVHGTKQEIPFSSDPPGAVVMVNGEQRGVTPTTITLKRGRDHQVIFKLDGYDDLLINLEKEMDTGWYIFGNLFSWGVIGWVVDIANGAAYKLSEDELHAAMQEETMGAALETPTDAYGMVVLTPDRATELGFDLNGRKNWAR